jgi:hypothetical protein
VGLYIFKTGPECRSYKNKSNVFIPEIDQSGREDGCIEAQIQRQKQHGEDPYGVRQVAVMNNNIRNPVQNADVIYKACYKTIKKSFGKAPYVIEGINKGNQSDPGKEPFTKFWKGENQENP